MSYVFLAKSHQARTVLALGPDGFYDEVKRIDCVPRMRALGECGNYTRDDVCAHTKIVSAADFDDMLSAARKRRRLQQDLRTIEANLSTLQRDAITYAP